jgi:PAS domain S-box-containing protein
VKESLDALDRAPHTSYHEASAVTGSGRRWLAWSNRAILDPEGQPLEYVAVGRDITEKKQAEDALRENQAWLQNILDSIQAGVVVIDPETHKIKELNRAALEMIGAPKDTIIDHVCHNYICPNDMGACPVTDLGLSIDQSDRELIRADGTRIPIMKTVNRAMINNREYLIESFLDMRDKKHLESMLLRSQKMEAIGTLAGGIAHDFNNILAAIMGYTELSQSNLPPEHKAFDYLDKIFKAGNRAKDLVMQILTFSRQAEYELKPVSVKIIAKEVLKLLGASLPANIEIRENIADDSLVLGDATQIHQVVMNLCTNAGQAMQKSGGVLEVSLSIETVDSAVSARYPDLKPGPYLNFTVKDTGPGILDHDLNRIFDPFFTTKKQGEGTGLGLAVVHGIVKNCGGTIQVASEMGRGSTFTVLLPKIDQGLVPVQEESQDLPRGREKILFVDDEPALVEVGKQLLKSLGYGVTVFTDPEKALELFARHPNQFDLVITDMTMPRMTGDLLAGHLLSVRKDIPIFLITGYNSEMTEARAMELGITGFLLKPVSLLHMARMVRKTLDRAVSKQS